MHKGDELRIMTRGWGWLIYFPKPKLDEPACALAADPENPPNGPPKPPPNDCDDAAALAELPENCGPPNPPPCPPYPPYGLPNPVVERVTR